MAHVILPRFVQLGQRTPDICKCRSIPVIEVQRTETTPLKFNRDIFKNVTVSTLILLFCKILVYLTKYSQNHCLRVGSASRVLFYWVSPDFGVCRLKVATTGVHRSRQVLPTPSKLRGSPGFLTRCGLSSVPATGREDRRA